MNECLILSPLGLLGYSGSFLRPSRVRAGRRA